MRHPCETCDGTGLAPAPSGIEITSRAEAGLAHWQNRAPKDLDRTLIRAMNVHDTGAHIADVDTITWVKGMQRYHMKTKRWSDIAYSYAVGRDGMIVECRGIRWDHFAEGATRKDRAHRYHGGGAGWSTVYGSIDWRLDHRGLYVTDFAKRSISVVCQVGLDDSADGYTEVTPEMLESLKQLRTYASEWCQSDIWVGTHRDHRIKDCPGPGLASHAENGRIGPWPEGLIVTTTAERNELALEYLAAVKKS